MEVGSEENHIFLACSLKGFHLWRFRRIWVFKILVSSCLPTCLHSIPWDLPSFSLVCACSVTWVISNSFVTPWTVAREAPLCMGFSRQEHWSGLPFPSPGDLPDLETEPGSPALQANSLPTEPPGRPFPSIPSAYCKRLKPKGLSIWLVWELCHLKVIF